MKRIRIGLNGFGRIGRVFTRIALEKNQFDIALINTRRNDTKMMRYLFQYDSTYRKYSKTVEYNQDGLVVDGRSIPTCGYSNPADIPWGDYDVDVVVDATGAFTTEEKLQPHMRDSVKKIILSAPAKDNMQQVVLGVNDNEIDWSAIRYISNASCTTNCAAPIFNVLHNAFGIEQAYLTTIHAYTQSQTLQDNANKKPDKSRAATANTIPSTTGAAKAVGKVIPSLDGKLDGMALRVPVPVGSFTDITAVLKEKTSEEEINALFMHKSADMPLILGYEKDVLVSSDYIGDSRSSIFDANYTRVINGNFVKVCSWYDNEFGYSNRLVDLVMKISDFV